MSVNIIVAMTKQRVIAKNNKIPWHIPGEINLFYNTIKDGVAIMGRKTYEAIVRKPHAKYNIVISSSLNTANYATICKKFEDALLKAKSFNLPIWILGGTQIYEEALSVADKIYVSYIKKDYEGDAYFPEFDEKEWIIESRKDFKEFEFVVCQKPPVNTLVA